MEQAVMNLPVKYREIIILYYYHEFDLKEISSLTGCNVHTAKTRLARGRELMKRRSEQDGSFNK